MNNNQFLIKIYNSHNEDKVYIKDEFVDNKFNTLEECFEYYRNKYPFNNVSVSPTIDNITISEILHKLNSKIKNV